VTSYRSVGMRFTFAKGRENNGRTCLPLLPHAF
jgi:hypothetical protein